MEPEHVETPEPVETPSMEDTLRETLRGLQEPAEDGQAEAEPVEKPSRTRDAGGRYAKADAEPVEQPSAQDDFPQSWQRELHDQWKALPENIRQHVHKREQDFHKGLEEYRQAAAVGNAMWQHIGPHVETMRQMGATPQQVIGELMGFWSQMSGGTPEQKRAVLLQIAQQAGIDMPQASSSASTDYQTMPPDFAPVLQRVQRTEAELQQLRAERQRADYDGRLDEVQRFQGDPKNEHFALVADEMLGMIRSGYAKSLAEAYDKACKISPAVAAKVAEKAATEQARKDAEKAAAARKAAAVNVARRGVAPAASVQGSIDDTLRKEYRRLNG